MGQERRNKHIHIPLHQAFLHMSVLVDSVSPRRLPINGQTMSWINHLDREQMGMVKRGRGCQEVYGEKGGVSRALFVRPS